MNTKKPRVRSVFCKEILAQKSRMRASCHRSDDWIEEYCPYGDEFDDDLMQFDPCCNGFTDVCDDVMVNDDVISGLQHSFLTREPCQQEIALKWALKTLGLDDIIFRTRMKDDN